MRTGAPAFEQRTFGRGTWVRSRRAWRSPGDLYRAWGYLALIPFSFMASIGAGELVKSLMGYPGRPLIDLTLEFAAPVMASAAVVFLLPCAAAWHAARRVIRAGDPRGWAPAVLAVTVCAGYLALDLFAIALARGLR